ncbi:MAG: FecR domain-containing protein, partial [Burkholderiaceae bacterium]
PSITVAPASITYITRAGDTLSSIAQQLTTKVENWVALSKVNNIGTDTNIPIGTAIVIPATLLPDEPSEAKVVALSGNIVAKTADGTPMAISLGAKITEGMQIDTGNNSFLTLSLPDASRISVPSNSRIKLAKLRMAKYTKSPRTEITLMRGHVESQVSPLEQNKGRFEVHTPLGVAGVRGTNFRVGVTNNGTANEVISGNVEVGQPGKPSPLTLHAGQGNIIDAKSVGKAVDLLPAPQLAENPTLLEATSAQISLTSVAGARAYHVQISSDAEGQNIFSETQSSGNKFAIQGVREGNYFARISSIDQYGLEGPARIQAISLKQQHATTSAQKNPQSPPYVSQSDAKHITLKWVAETGKKFKVQVARDTSFSWLLFTTNTTTPEATLPRLPFGTYYARVQSINADGSASPFSNHQAFIVTDQWVMNDGNPVTAKDSYPNAKH